ncbi:MAG: hypothetical protein JSS86_10830 [Cyanobacteria bacterium SZAS LIN-2]|nr:hypothetical protein [Cyanobacteria bacterium SZAS LIN-2]
MDKTIETPGSQAQSGRWFSTRRTARFLAFLAPIIVSIAMVPAAAPAARGQSIDPNANNAAPGAFVQSTETNGAVGANQAAQVDPNSYQGAPQYYDPNMGQNPYPNQPAPDQQYPTQPVYQGAYQGSATIGVTGTPTQPPQMMQAMPPQMMQPPAQMPVAQPQIQAPPQTPVANSAPSEFPTLDELKQTLAKNAQTGQGQSQGQGQMNNSPTPGTTGGVGGVGATLLKALGTMTGPSTYGTRPMGMGMGYPGMGMGGMGMGGMGMGGMGMGGMGMGGMGMGGMGMNPFMPRQSMMNSLINQGLYSGVRLLSH